MKPGWSKRCIAVLILFSFFSLSVSLAAGAAETQSLSSAPVAYQLTASFAVEVKSVVNEKTSEGRRIAAVVRLSSQDSQTATLPEYELRAVTTEGRQYTLRPSTGNAKVIEPKEKVELSYLLDVKSSEEFSLSNLSWVQVNEEIYPKKENTLLSIPVPAMEWKGDAPVFSERDTIGQWGQPFAIPALSKGLQYTPVYLLSETNGEELTNELIFLVENQGETNEFIPDLIINGESDHKIFAGTKVEQSTQPLEPGEQRYMHYKIPAQTKDELKSFYILNAETFADDNRKLQYTVGRIHIALPGSPANARDKIFPYEFNIPIGFDALNTLIHPDLEVSLVELHMNEIDGNGYQTAAAKFKIRNRSNHSRPLPSFGAELMSSEGSRYTGTRQSTSLKMLMPNLSYIVNYAFSVPNSESGKRVTMSILDGQTEGIPIASLQTEIQEESGTTLDIYPFHLKVNDWSLAELYNFAGGSLTRSYKLRLDMEVERQENVVIDRNFSKLQAELVDSDGTILGVESIPFSGAKRIANGVRTIDFEDLDNNDIQYPISILFYEAFDTPDGEVKRLLLTLEKAK